MEKAKLAALVAVAFVLFVGIPSVKHAAVIHSDAAAEAQETVLQHLERANRQQSPQQVKYDVPVPEENAAVLEDRTGPTLQQPLALSAVVTSTSYGCYKGSSRAWRPGKCADDNAWLVPWMAAKPQDDWTLVDVGANKGYVIAGWLETLLGRSRTPFTPHNLGVSIYTNNDIKEGFTNMCGGCTECADPPADVPEEHRARSVKVYGFEPSIANYRWLSFFYNDSNIVEIVNAAVSHTPGTAYFPDGVLGKETGKVSAVAAPGFVPVKIVSLDMFLADKNVSFIDILSTDAEGFDQDVAKGAESWIKNGRVGVYQFEMYRAEDYKTIFERLYEWGYVCFYFTEVRKGFSAPWLIRISGCWQPYFQNLIGWVNGLCYNSKVPALGPIFNRLTRKVHRSGGPSRLGARRKVMRFVQTYVPQKKDTEAQQQ